MFLWWFIYTGIALPPSERQQSKWKNFCTFIWLVVACSHHYLHYCLLLYFNTVLNGHVHTITYITVCFCTSTVCSMDMFTPLLTLLFVTVLQQCAQWTCSHRYLHYCLFLYFNTVLSCHAIAILITFTLFMWWWDSLHSPSGIRSSSKFTLMVAKARPLHNWKIIKLPIVPSCN